MKLPCCRPLPLPPSHWIGISISFPRSFLRSDPLWLLGWHLRFFHQFPRKQCSHQFLLMCLSRTEKSVHCPHHAVAHVNFEFIVRVLSEVGALTWNCNTHRPSSTMAIMWLIIWRMVSVLGLGSLISPRTEAIFFSQIEMVTSFSLLNNAVTMMCWVSELCVSKISQLWPYFCMMVLTVIICTHPVDECIRLCKSSPIALLKT